MQKPFYAPEARSDLIWALVISPKELLLCWLALINLAAFLAFGLDKRRARRKEARPSVRRVPERTLFLLAALGGSAGALLGMRFFHHKTRHRSFRWGLPALLLLQLALAGAFYFAYNR